MSRWRRSPDDSALASMRRLALEPLPSLFTFEEFFRQDLDRDVSPEPRVLRPVDLPHPARAERGEDLVRRRGGCRRRSLQSFRQIESERTRAIDEENRLPVFGDGRG